MQMTTSKYADLEWTPIEGSSVIRSLGQESDRVLYVKLHSGSVYAYDVEEAKLTIQHLAFLSEIDSIGSFWNKYLKGKYNEREVHLQYG